MSPSIKDVAKRAGVSISTVSRILNGTAKVDAAKERAVREAIAYLQYEPNQLGRGLVKQRTEMIGVYFQKEESILDSTYDLELIKGASEILSRENYSLVLLTENPDSQGDTEAKPVFYRYVREKRIDGLLLRGLPASIRKDEAFVRLVESGYPVSYIGKQFHETGFHVYAQFEWYHLEMLRQFYECGHRNVILYYIPFHDHYINAIVQQAQARFPKLTVFPATLEEDRGRQTVQLWQFIAEKHCTAVCCPGIPDVERLLGCCAELGVSVPGQLSIIAAEHRRGEGESCYPAISAMYVPAREMGRFAARQLLAAIRADSQVPQQQEFPVEFISRDSVCRKNPEE